MKTVMFNPYTGTPRHPSDIASDPSGLLILEPGAPLRAAAQVVALEPEGPDGHGVNWLAGKRPKPGDLLYAGDAAARAEPARDAHRGGDSYEASMLRNLLALIHGDGGQYLEAHGLDKALENAERIVAARTAALTELVALQDMKDRLHKLHEMGHGTDYASYQARLALAWIAARAAMREFGA